MSMLVDDDILAGIISPLRCGCGFVDLRFAESGPSSSSRGRLAMLRAVAGGLEEFYAPEMHAVNGPRGVVAASWYAWWPLWVGTMHIERQREG